MSNNAHCKPTTLESSLAATKLHIGNEYLPIVTSVRDLGITIDNNRKFTPHINDIVRKATVRAKLIMKCFHSRDTATLLRAFKTYVRPLLEFNSPVWSPRFTKDINLIENVQRRFTKYLPGMFNKSYDERLTILNLDKLEARRIKADLITTYKIIFGHITIDSGKFFRIKNYNITRGHKYKLTITNAHCDTFRYSFAQRIVSLWNSLPSHTDFSTIHNFINSLSLFNVTKICKGRR